MSLHIHHLYGCSPTPLALYLKAIGILRLVAEQADPDVRGWWQDEHFCLMTSINQNEIVNFFLENYSPTAVFNPWGGRSGFYDGSSEKTTRVALNSVENSALTRLSDFHKAIEVVRNAVGDEKPSTDTARYQLINDIRLNIRGSSAKWLSTVLSVIGSNYYAPPILGTGGNEGSGSYTAAFFAAIGECLILRSWDNALSNSLFSPHQQATQSWDGSFPVQDSKNKKKLKTETIKNPFRQFLPEDNLCPWDLLFMFEGACAFRSGVTRRSASGYNQRLASSPFYFSPHGIGALSSCDSDEFVINKGRRQPGRGEQWFPIWKSPTTFGEFQSLLSEGRCVCKRRKATKPIEALQAIDRLGVDRGISEFIRYGYLQRNNLATHFAVPLGRIQVKQHPRSYLIDDIAPWMDGLQRLARESHAPARLIHAERRLANAVFAVLSHDDTPQRWQAVLEAAADIELLQKGGTALKAGPIPKLQCAWINAIHDNSPEVRLALSIGSAALYNKEQQPYNQIRYHWLPLEKGVRRFKIKDKRLIHDVRVVMTGRDTVADCAALVNRRLIEAQAEGKRILPLQSAFGCEARLSDIALLLDGQVDLERVLTLGRALMALNWRGWDKACLPQVPRSDTHLDEAWLALRLACLPWPITRDLTIPAEAAILSRLLSGDGAAAIRIAILRLRASGIRVPFSSAFTDHHTARLWAAALAFPISRHSARRAVSILSPNSSGDNHD